jgi:aspartyl-tRNA(Asn)/glutamyl-tRNA(Gln) amidotransferase subunit C
VKIDVSKIATLARLDLKSDEVERLGDELGTILDYVEQLRELDTKDVAPTAHVEAVGTPLRDDEPRPTLPVEEALANAPDKKGSAFKVPKIIE